MSPDVDAPHSDVFRLPFVVDTPAFVVEAAASVAGGIAFVAVGSAFVVFGSAFVVGGLTFVVEARFHPKTPEIAPAAKKNGSTAENPCHPRPKRLTSGKLSQST